MIKRPRGALSQPGVRGRQKGAPGAQPPQAHSKAATSEAALLVLPREPDHRR
jgi:hypothetical protein